MKSKIQKGTLKIAPDQPIHAATVGNAALELLECLEKAGESMPVEIDVSNTEIADSGTIKFLLAAANDCRQRGLKPGARTNIKTGELLRLVNMDRHIALITEKVSK